MRFMTPLKKINREKRTNICGAAGADPHIPIFMLLGGIYFPVDLFMGL